MSTELCVATALAEVMVYNEASKKWQPPPGSDGQVSKVEIMQHSQKPSFRIISLRETDGKWLLNCNIHQKLKYHSATATFHQWRDEHRQVYGLNFQVESDARMFVSIIGQAIDHLTQQAANHHNEYQQPHPVDNVYQDPHQHLMQIQSAPSFDHLTSHHLHDENQMANFRKLSQHPMNALAQQQRRVSQASNTSGGNNVYSQETNWNSGNTPLASATSTSIPTPPATSKIPPAPPAPSTVAPMAMASAIPLAPPIANIAPVSSNAPPPPPPPPPPNFGVSGLGNGKATSLADQLKVRSQQLNRTNGNASSAVAGGSQNVVVKEEKTAAPPAAGNLMSELAATINKRKMTQAKADAVDSKSNTSNGSTDSGCGTATSVNGVSNCGSVGSATAKKWSVSEAKPTESPKTHRKLPSASSLFTQEDVAKSNGSNREVNTLTSEDLERFKAELLVEVRLEINRAKQEIIETIKSAFSKN